MAETEGQATKAKEKKEAPAPNIKFVGKRPGYDEETGLKLEMRKALPEEVPTIRIDGLQKFKLPSGEEQLAGFYHKDAELLARAWRKDFKLLVDKGGKKNG